MRKALNNLILWIGILVITLLPLSLSKFGVNPYFMPQIEIPCVFLLALYCNVSSLQIFLYGLFIDVAYGSPLGVSSLILLLAHKLITRFKNALLNQDNTSITTYFICTAFIIAFIKYLIIGLAKGIMTLPSGWDLLLNFLVTLISYPILLILYFSRSKP